jgi:hypothetical protein
MRQEHKNSTLRRHYDDIDFLLAPHSNRTKWM